MEIKNANELGWVNAFETPLLSSFDQTIMAIYIGSEKSTFMNFGCNGINTCYQKFQLKITGFNLKSELDPGASVYINLYIYSAQQFIL